MLIKASPAANSFIIVGYLSLRLFRHSPLLPLTGDGLYWCLPRCLVSGEAWDYLWKRLVGFAGGDRTPFMSTANRHFKTEGWLLPVLLGAPIVVGLVAAFVMP